MSRTLYCGDIVLAGSDLLRRNRWAVMVEDGRIVALDAESAFDSFDGETIRCPVLMPGLIDCHAHMALDAGIYGWPERVLDREAEQVLRAVNTLKADLLSGVTTVRFMGDRDFIDVAVARAVREGRLDGPRPIIGTRGIKASHAHGMVGYGVDGVEARRRFARENMLAGADFLKLFITDTAFSPDIVCFPTREEIAVVVEEAHNAGRKAAAHCTGGVGLDYCLDLGVDTIEHGYYTSDAQMERMARNGTWLVVTPTPVLSDYYAGRRGGKRQPPPPETRAVMITSMRAAIQAGVNCAIGSDGLHGRLANDIKHFVEFGARPNDALLAATIRGAQLCGVEKETGSLEIGKCADFIGLRQNPLENIDALADVALVVRNGNIYKNR